MADPILFQHYEVLTRGDGAPWELGRGAMGITYKALDSNLRVPVALKVIHPHQLHSEVAAQRFVREARAAARLRHPNIASVFHLGRDRDTWFYAMEFIDGETAESLVKRNGPLSESVALQFTAQIARALSAAENHDLVHRDIKPANLMIVSDDNEWVVKLIDFGLARSFAAGEADEDLATVTHGGFLGTPYYASPEQLEQKELDIRSDIYSLGVTLWFLLSAKVPFSGSMMAVMTQHLQRVPPLEQLGGLASAETINLIARMLEKEPASRPQTAGELRREVEKCLSKSSTVSTATLPEISRSSPSTAPTTPEQESAQTTTMETAPAATEPEGKLDAAASRFELVENLESLPFGAFARGKDRESGALLRVLRLDRQFGADATTVAALNEVIARAKTISSPVVLKVIGSELADGEFRLAVEWTNACTWLELLRVRGELSPEEAWPLLAQAAEGCDAVLAAGIDSPEVSLAALTCILSVDAVERAHRLQLPLTQWPELEVKVSPLGALRDLTLAVTWSGDRTVAPPLEAPQPHGLTEVVRAFARVTYELLGGRINPGAISGPPLPALAEKANELLRKVLQSPAEFTSLISVVEALSEAQRSGARDRLESAPATPLVVEAPVAEEQANANVPEEPLIITEPEIPFEVAADVAVAEPEVVQQNEEESGFITEVEPADESAVDEIPALSPSANATVAPVEYQLPPSAFPTEVPGKTTRRAARAVVLSGVGVVALSGLGIWWWQIPRGGQAIAAPTPAISASPTPAPSTPVVAAATPQPTKTKAQLQQELFAKADRLSLGGSWEEAAKLLLDLHRESPPRAIVDLGILFRKIRWLYTPRGDFKAELKEEQVEQVLDEAQRAAEIGVGEAMMLLGQHFSTGEDWKRGLEWYEKAKSKGLPKAYTRIGLVTARFAKTPEEMRSAWEHLENAAELNDLDGRVAVADCLINGDLNGIKVPGLEKNEERAAKILQEVIKEGSNTPPADEADPDIYLTQPNRAKLMLADLYHQMEGRPEGERPQWYQAIANRALKANAVRWLEEASEFHPSGYAILGAAAELGTLMKKDSGKAEEYFKKGGNDPAAMFGYALFLVRKAPTGTVPMQAQDLLIKSAERGNRGAQAFCSQFKISYKPPAN